MLFMFERAYNITLHSTFIAKNLKFEINDEMIISVFETVAQKNCSKSDTIRFER